MSASASSCSPLIDAAFYERSVHEVARDLIGCSLRFAGVGGVIVETESYERDDPACHAYVGRTARTETLFGPPGRAYVYLSYGIHCLLNAVCEPEGVGAAVLIRALEPLDGVELMHARRGVSEVHQLCSGPGKLAQALGIGLRHDDTSLISGPVRMLRAPADAPALQRVVGTRIGITKAAELPWRVAAEGSRFVSRPWPAAPRVRRTAAPAR